MQPSPSPKCAHMNTCSSLHGTGHLTPDGDTSRCLRLPRYKTNPWEATKRESNTEMPLPPGRAEQRVRSRGLPRNRGLDRKCGIMAVVIRRLLVVGGAGERPAKASLTSPVFALPDGPLLRRAFARLAYECSKKSARRLPRCAGDCPHALQCLRLRFGAVRIVASVCVPGCDRTIVGESYAIASSEPASSAFLARPSIGTR